MAHKKVIGAYKAATKAVQRFGYNMAAAHKASSDAVAARRKKAGRRITDGA